MELCIYSYRFIYEFIDEDIQIKYFSSNTFSYTLRVLFIQLYFQGVLQLDDSLSFLYNFLKVYGVDRPFIHSLVFWLWRKFGQEIPSKYHNCEWRLTIHGVFCDELEKDLQYLLDIGAIKQGSSGLIEFANNKPYVYIERINEVINEATIIYLNDVFSFKLDSKKFRE